jgi:hypothetical protein
MVKRTLFGADSRIPGAASKSDSIPTIITSPNSGADKSVLTANGVSRTGRSLSPTEPGARNYPKSPSTVLESPHGKTAHGKTAHGKTARGKTARGKTLPVNPCPVNPCLVNPCLVNPVRVVWGNRACRPGMAYRRRLHGGVLPTHPTGVWGRLVSDQAMPSVRSKRITIRKRRSTSSLRTVISIPRTAPVPELNIGAGRER